MQYIAVKWYYSKLLHYFTVLYWQSFRQYFTRNSTGFFLQCMFEPVTPSASAEASSIATAVWPSGSWSLGSLGVGFSKAFSRWLTVSSELCNLFITTSKPAEVCSLASLLLFSVVGKRLHRCPVGGQCLSPHFLQFNCLLIMNKS